MNFIETWLPIVGVAWAGGALLALLSAPLGVLVVWRGMSFFADTLAHGALLGVALALWVGAPAWVGVGGMCLLVALALLFVSDERLPKDAILATVASFLLCMGLVTLTQLTQYQANVLGFLFGNLLDLDRSQLPALATLVMFGGLCLMRLWGKCIMLATSRDLAHVSGVKAGRVEFGFMVLLGMFCALALSAVGSLLVSGLLVLPALSARLIAKSPRQMVILALIIAQIGVFVGILASVVLNLATGLAIILALASGFFCILGVFKVIR